VSNNRSSNVVQATGQVAGDIVNGLRQQPMLLALVVLNVMGIGAALWVLKDLSQISNERYMEMSKLVNHCFAFMSKQMP
jgi:hypothetical protein